MLPWRAPQSMYEACLEMLERATVVGATETFMTVFRPAHPLRPQGALRWHTRMPQHTQTVVLLCVGGWLSVGSDHAPSVIHQRVGRACGTRSCCGLPGGGPTRWRLTVTPRRWPSPSSVASSSAGRRQVIGARCVGALERVLRTWPEPAPYQQYHLFRDDNAKLTNSTRVAGYLLCPGGEGGRFDLLPLVIQDSPISAPKVW